MDLELMLMDSVAAREIMGVMLKTSTPIAIETC